MDACTIVARRDLARARVLVSSFRAQHPDAHITVLVLDGVDDADEVQGGETITLAQLLGAEAGMLAAGNPPGAIEIAALPHLLRHLISEGGSQIAYLAAGLRVLGPLQELEQALVTHEITVVARASTADTGTEDAFRAREGGGAIDHRTLGCSAGPRLERLLAAWPRYFADETRAVHDWFDGIPAIGENVGVLRDAGYGLDPWSVSAARAEQDSEVLRIEGRPARTFDFGSLDPPAASLAGNSRRDARLSSIAALTHLRERHAQEMLDDGWEEDQRRGWRFGTLDDGAAITELMRKLLLEGIAEGDLTESPYTHTGRETFYAYLSEPAEIGASAGISRLHLEIWRSRPDVQAAYPHLDGPDGIRFAAWLCEHAIADHGVPESLLPWQALAQEQGEAEGTAPREPLWGVNVAGFFTSELGLGEAARLLISGLDAGGVPALPVQARLLPPCGQKAEFTYASPDDAPYPINIVCVNGDLVAPFAREVGGSFFEGRHTIALWWWEVGELPKEWAAAFEHIDEIWVGSQHIYDAIAPESPVPVMKMTMPVALPRVPRYGRAELGMPEDGFLFLYVHDYHSTAARKNPVGTIEAFRRAFPPGSGAKLVLKSINAENVMHEHDRVMLAAGDHPDITLIDAYVSASEKNAMIAACDCYVSLHRSEGFGLTAAEAMLLGKPVIATAYGGNLEFMTQECSHLVDWTPVHVGEDAHPYPPDGVWADPDLDQAAKLMREVVDDPERARSLGEIGRRHVLKTNSPEAAGERMRRRLQLVHERLGREEVKAPSLTHWPPPPHPELPELIAREAPVQGSGLKGMLKRVVRRATRRLMQPFLSRQHAIDSRLQVNVADLEDRLHAVARELRDRQEANLAETLAMVRKLDASARDTRVAIQNAEADINPRIAAVERLGHELGHHLDQHRATPYVSDERAFSGWQHPIAGRVLGYRMNGVDSAQRRYFDFERTFRGPESRVAEIQRRYLPLLAGHQPVLDIGCGRGEMLDLLREASIEASGVDLDAGMVEHARAKGHDVMLGDGVEHLRSMAAGSLGAVVAIEVIEHLPYERLTELLQLARSRLRDDGVLLVETVNPHAIDAMKAFWVDPTHVQPIFPEVTLELCRLAGFSEAFWFHPTGDDDFDRDREREPVYAVLAGRMASDLDTGR